MSDSDQYSYEYFYQPLAPPEKIAQARSLIDGLTLPCPFAFHCPLVDPFAAPETLPPTVGEIDQIITRHFGPVVAAEVRLSVH